MTNGYTELTEEEFTTIIAEQQTLVRDQTLDETIFEKLSYSYSLPILSS
jgi:hypothetical protein